MTNPSAVAVPAMLYARYPWVTCCIVIGIYENSNPEMKVRKFGSLRELKAAGNREVLPASATPAGAGSALCIARARPNRAHHTPIPAGRQSLPRLSGALAVHRSI